MAALFKKSVYNWKNGIWGPAQFDFNELRKIIFNYYKIMIEVFKIISAVYAAFVRFNIIKTSFTVRLLHLKQ